MTASLPAIIPDTNFLLDHPTFYKENWLIKPLEVLISDAVAGELPGLAKNGNPGRAVRAQAALAELKRLRTEFADRVFSEYQVKVIFSPFQGTIPPPLDAGKTDHQVIALARKQRDAPPPHFCAILTRDRELRHIAEALSLLVVSTEEPRRFQTELKRKYVWYLKGQQAHWDQAGETPRKARFRLNHQRPDPQSRLKRFVRYLYRRVKAVGFRAILSLSPLQARQGLTLELIQ